MNPFNIIGKLLQQMSWNPEGILCMSMTRIPAMRKYY
ncbi:hypothetical protein HDC92_001642 [Pedobacter sp. AK017]|nr:hypothetical protein [Pedobacter sp. AK017]